MSSISLLELFRTLATFSPKRTVLEDAPWETYVPWAIGNGLAPLASYNLEYVLAGSRAPQWARGQLLSIYQGSANDNVLKLVMFKRLVGNLEGRRLILMGSAILAEALYPHIAFRPVIELELLMRRMDVEPFSGFLANQDFKPDTTGYEDSAATRVLSDGSTPILLFTDPLGAAGRPLIEGVFERAIVNPLYGSSVYRPSPEDTLLLALLSLAREGFAVPFVSFVDLRELVLGAPTLGDPLELKPDPEVLLARAAEWKLERSLWAAMTLVERLFPETHDDVQPLLPKLSRTSRTLLERGVVTPLSTLTGALTETRGAARLRRLLTGGR